ncbi:hypothetical protein GF386_06830, partial [Candidatus Pacearchaeota archaeon]|nr:hypothetical protein [Candidatus Pacearchaeota archaeon]MBD3283795.1 hypothetical protein [Candidatus Pacearchaeota archaeon]
MKKWLKIFLIIFLILVLIIAGLIIYFYYFHVFYEMRICIGSDEQNLNIPCQNNKGCVDFLLENVPEMKASFDEAPEIIKEKMNEVFEKSVYCETTCRMKKIYGGGFGSNVDKCMPGE